MNAALPPPCVAAVLGCTRGVPARGAGVAVPAGSLSGTVAVVGSNPGTWVVPWMEGSTHAETLSGDSAALLRRVTGFDVTVWGAAERPDVFREDRFVVRAVDGQAAVDGTPRRADSGWRVHPADGAPVAVPSFPGGRDGAHAWLVRASGGRVTGFGVIRDP